MLGLPMPNKGKLFGCDLTCLLSQAHEDELFLSSWNARFLVVVEVGLSDNKVQQGSGRGFKPAKLCQGVAVSMKVCHAQFLVLQNGQEIGTLTSTEHSPSSLAELGSQGLYWVYRIKRDAAVVGITQEPIQILKFAREDRTHRSTSEADES